MVGLSRGRYSDGFVWFAGLPGLYHFWGIAFTYAELNPAFFRWGITGLVLALLGLAVSGFRRNARWAVAWGLPLLLLRPEGWLLVLLLLAHGVWMLERERRLSAEFGRGFSWQPRSLLVGLGLVGLVGLGLSGLRPVGMAPLSLPGVQAPKPERPRPNIAAPQEPTDLVVSVVPKALRLLVGFMDELLEVLLNAALFLMGLITLLLLILGWGKSSGSWSNGIRVLQVLVVFITWGMLLFWYGLNGRGEGSGGGLGQAAQSGSPGEAVGRIIERETFGTATLISYSLALLASLVGVLLLAVGLWLILRHWNKTSDEPEGLSPASKAPEVKGLASEAPSNRIRRAYQQLEAELNRLGFARQLWESPLEYAKRLGGLRPASSQAFLELIQLYQPVRYGGLGLETQAHRAEHLAAALPALFREEVP
jgi:hypothetical protein